MLSFVYDVFIFVQKMKSIFLFILESGGKKAKMHVHVNIKFLKIFGFSVGKGLVGGFYHELNLDRDQKDPKYCTHFTELYRPP